MKRFGAILLVALAMCCASDASRTSTSILDNCETVQASSSTDISLSCKLRTINSEFDRTNLSGLPGDMLTSLRLECSDVLFYQSSLDSSTLSHLTRLTSLHVEHCKLSRLPTGVFEGLDVLRNLTIRTHNTAWPALSLDIDAGVFSGLDRLEKVDLSSNNIWTFPEGSFCGCVNLAELNLSQNRLQDLNVLGFNERKTSSKKRHGSNCGETSSPIEVLNVSKNRLILLPPNGLAKLGLLRELYLDGNEISIVSGGAFGSLALLKVLNLADNKIEQLPAEVFAANRELSEVYLQNNSLATVNPQLFAKLDQMVILDLSKNKLTSDKLTGDKNGSSPFAGLIRLVNLNLAHNRLTILKAAMFQDLFSLQVLNLEGNSVATIEANAFADLKNLHTLSLSKNKLAYIDSTTLNGLFMLTFLSLDNNAIEAIHPEAFHNNSNVRDINLNGNAFTKIPAAIQNLTFLKTLDLGENAITELDSVALMGLPNLYGLRFTGNQIVNVSSGVFKNLPMLKVVNLARNQINSVAPGTFDSNSNLQAVRLDANYLTDLNGLFAELPSLLWLNVSDNRLTWFDYGLIPQQLMWLDLHKNQITQLQNDYQRTEFRLQTLDASYNLLTSIGSSIIPDSLENLYLNDNLLKSIEPNCFYNKVNLSRIDLFMNQLETLELSALALSPDRQVGAEVYMSGNPFICDCKLDWIQRVNRLATSGGYPMVMDLDNIYCQLPYHQVQKKEMEKRGRFFEEDPMAALAEVPHYFSPSMDSSSPIVLPINQVAVDQFLCPYTSHCFDNCHCCDFEACDCQMTCPGGCQCYHDNSWTVNIVDCSASGNGGQVAQVPLPPSIQSLPRFPSHVPQEVPQGGGGEASSSPRKTIPTTIPMDSTEIHLDGNQLDFLPSHVFIGRRNLERLYLNDSRIDTIMNNSFSGLRKLSVLHLEDNFLREIHGYEFEPLESLRELYLHGNQISFLAGNAFVHLKNLQVLTLSGNQITRFSLWSFNFHPYLTRVALDENPWSCDCDFLIQALPWIQNNLDKLTSLEEINGGELELTTPPASAHSNENRQRFRGPMEQLINPTGGGGWSSSRPKRPINLNCVVEETGKSWSLLRLNASVCTSGESVVSSVFEDDIEGVQNAPGGGGSAPTPLDPSPFPYLPSILAIGGVLIFVSTVFFLVCFRRGRLGLFGKRSLAETCLGGVSGPETGTCYDTAPAEDSDKLFDAYIAYSVKDEAWVSQILAQNIQQQNLHHSDQPYRLCLHYRDFVMTAYIADTIVEAVESSRRTIVVLSKNFLQSEWCSYEFKSALHTAIRGGNMRNRLVIVTLGDISTRDLDPDLRVMLRNAIVLQASDKLFWSKLKNTLPEPRPVVGGGGLGTGVASAAGSLWRQYSTTNKSVHSASTASYYDVNERNNWLQPGLIPQQQQQQQQHQQHSTSTTNTSSCSSGASPQPPPLPPMHHHPIHQHQLSGGHHQQTLPHQHQHHHNHHLHQHSHSGPGNNAHLQTVLDNYHNVQCNQMIQMMMAKGQMMPPQEVEKGHYSYVETA